LYRPWIYNGPFRYTHDYVRESFRVFGFDNPNLLRTNVSEDFVFVNRLQWGLNSVLAILNAEANWRREMLSLLLWRRHPNVAAAASTTNSATIRVPAAMKSRHLKSDRRPTNRNSADSALRFPLTKR